MSDKEKLALLRIQLYTAMQQLKGQDLKDFWALLEEVQSCRTDKA